MQAATDLEHTVELAAAIADPTRTRALLALRHRELCVCQLVELLGLSTSTVSRHLSQLRRAGLVQARRDGRWTWYRRPLPGTDRGVDALLAWLDANLGATDVAASDRLEVDAILCRIPGPCSD